MRHAQLRKHSLSSRALSELFGRGNQSKVVARRHGWLHSWAFHNWQLWEYSTATAGVYRRAGTARIYVGRLQVVLERARRTPSWPGSLPQEYDVHITKSLSQAKLLQVPHPTAQVLRYHRGVLALTPTLGNDESLRVVLQNSFHVQV